jgi:ribosomal protein S18 acetylase RimI-like enzyme
LFLESRRAAFHWQSVDQFKLYDLDEVIEGEVILIALRAQEPIGFVAWWPPGEFVHHLFISPEHLRRGIGRALLCAAVEQLGRPARLKCLCRNEKALAFYQRMGWEVEQREAGENGEYYAMVLRE